jgi:hypothetical protein
MAFVSRSIRLAVHRLSVGVYGVSSRIGGWVTGVAFWVATKASFSVMVLCARLSCAVVQSASKVASLLVVWFWNACACGGADELLLGFA